MLVVDRDLDVVSVDGNVRIFDRDEFEEHPVRWNYPAHVVTNAETEVRYVELAITDRQFPFDGSHLSASPKFLD